MKLITSLAVATVAVALAPYVAAAVPEYGARFDYSGKLIGAGGGGTDLPVSGSVYDKDIHSGAFRSANGTSSDSYVLQGGDPFGGDTGDAFEVTQAPGHYDFGTDFDVFTHYIFGQPGTQVGTFIFANPDTGYLQFQNNSGFEFKGTLTLSGHAAGGIYGPEQDFSNSGSVDLLNTESGYIVLNDESSNYGGYNHPDVPGQVPDGGSTIALLTCGLVGLGALRRKLS